MPAGTSNAAPSATPARNARPRWARARTSTAASVIVGATPYKARAKREGLPKFAAALSYALPEIM